MLEFFVLGAALGLLLVSVEMAPRHRGLSMGLAVLAVALFAAAFVDRPVGFLGALVESWYDTSPCKEAILLLLMLLGMAARSLDEAIVERHRQIEELRKAGRRWKPRLRIDPWEFSRPFLVSVATFGGLLSQIGNNHLSIATLVLGFQTGFFWQTLLKKPS